MVRSCVVSEVALNKVVFSAEELFGEDVSFVELREEVWFCSEELVSLAKVMF